MGAAAAGAQILGGVISAAGASQRADAQRQALRSRASLQKKQADERLRQLDVEMDIFEQKREIAFGDAVSSYARAGVSIGTGSPLMQLASTEANLQNTMEEMDRKGRKEAELIRAGADQLEQSADRIDPTLEMVGSVLGGIGGAANIMSRG